MTEFLGSHEANDDLLRELRRENMASVLNTVQTMVDSDERRVRLDTSLKDYGLPADMPQHEKNRYDIQYNNVLSLLQHYWWESRQDPHKMPEIATIRIDISQPINTEPRNAMYMTVRATSIDDNETRFATVSWVDAGGMVRVYDMFLDENGHTSMLQTVDFPDDGFFQDVMIQLSDKRARRLFDYAYHGAIPMDGLEPALEYIKLTLGKSCGASAAEKYVSELRKRSINARDVYDLVKAMEADANMTDIELLELHETLKSQSV